MEPLSLEEIKQRVDICMRAHLLLFWSEEEDFGPVRVEQLANARACGPVAEIFEVLGLQWLQSY
jgi:hypothetical protein